MIARALFTCRVLLTVVVPLASAGTIAGASKGMAGKGVALDVPVMAEVARAAGLVHSYTGPWEYFVGGGVAAFDCDGDRRPDLAFSGGTSGARLYVNQSTRGTLSFREREDAFPGHLSRQVIGLYPLDIDNDRIIDLVMLRVGANAILKGLGDCRFAEASRRFGFDGGRAWTTAFAATWEAGARFPTLAIGNYVDRSAPGSPWGTCHDNLLLRPDPRATSPDYSALQVLSPGYCALSMLFTDWNRSGTPSLRITNDRQYYRDGEEQLWRINSGQPARPYRAADGWRTLRIWGMGIAEADLDADGLPEYALTSMGDTKLQQLEAGGDEMRPTYRDVAFERAATAHRPYTGEDLRPSTGWHAEFADFNNDGRTDLFIAKGNVERMPDFAAYDPDNLLLGRADGTFTEVGLTAGIALDRRGRGAAVVDLDMDGALDLIVVNREAPVSVFRNTGGRPSRVPAEPRPRPLGNWLSVELDQPDANRFAVGATIVVKAGNQSWTRTVSVGGGHASGRMTSEHFGLGTAERAEVRVRWPDGDWSAPYRVFANTFAIIGRGSEHARVWFPSGADQQRARDGADAPAQTNGVQR